MNFRLDIFLDLFLELLPYVKVTLFLAILSFILAFVLSIFISIIVEYKVPVLYQIIRVYISFFRCTPIITQLFFFYFVVTLSISFLEETPPSFSLVIVLGMSNSAYMSETIRGAISSVDIGQREAALTIGMTEIQSMLNIVLPQALRVAIPGLSNSFIGIVKGTSIGYTIGVMELMSRSKLISGQYFRVTEAYLAVLIIYWVLIGILSLGQKYLEKRMSEAYR